MRLLGAVEAGVAAAQAAHLHHHLGGRLGHEDDVAAVGGAVGETPARALAERAAECPVCRIRGGQQSAFQLASNAVSSSARVDGKCRGGGRRRMTGMAGGKVLPGEAWDKSQARGKF